MNALRRSFRTVALGLPYGITVGILLIIGDAPDWAISGFAFTLISVMGVLTDGDA